MSRSLVLGLSLLLFPSFADAAVIQSASNIVANPGVTMFSPIQLGEGTATGGTGLAITVNMTTTDINDDKAPANTGRAQYIVTSQGGAAPNPGIATYTVNVTNSDPSPAPEDLFKDFVISITSNGPPVSIMAPFTSAAGFSVTSSSATEIIWRNNVGAGAGVHVFGFDLSIPNPSGGGAGFTLAATARNPEPGSMALAAVAMTVLGGGAARRRHKKKMKAQAEPEALAI